MDRAAAIATLDDATSHAHWDDALVAADALHAVDLDQLDDARTAQVAQAIARAVEGDRRDLAANLATLDLVWFELDTTPRTLIDVWCAGDLVAVLAALEKVENTMIDEHSRIVYGAIARRVTAALDGGTWEQRVLGTLANKHTLATKSHDERDAARIAWAGARDLPPATDVLEFIAARAFLAAPGPLSAEAAACEASRLFAEAGDVFAAAATIAGELFDRGIWARTFTCFATSEIHAGRHDALAARIAALDWSKSRTKLLADSLEWSRQRVATWRYNLETRGAVELADDEPVTMTAIGTFAIESGVVMLGDPGYTGELLRLSTTAIGVRCGSWIASVARVADGRCIALLAHHVDHPHTLADARWTKQGGFDVEYGHAGIFDASHFNARGDVPSDVVVREGEHPWFELCLARAPGVVPFGCVARSGDGDGSYDAYVLRTDDDARAAVALALAFPLAREDDDEDDDDAYEDDEVGDD